MVAEDGNARDGAGRLQWDAVAAGVSGHVEEILTAELAQIVDGPLDRVVVFGLPDVIADVPAKSLTVNPFGVGSVSVLGLSEGFDRRICRSS